MSAPPSQPAAHDWRGLVPADRPVYPAACKWIRHLSLTTLAASAVAVLSLHAATRQSRQRTTGATLAAAAAQARADTARAELAAAQERAVRVQRLGEWLESHPPVRPLLFALLTALEHDPLAVADLSLSHETSPAPWTLHLAFRSTPPLARTVLADLPAAVERAGWRLVPIRQEQDPTSGETTLHAALGRLAP